MIEPLETWSPRRWARLALIAAVSALVIYVLVRAWDVLLPFLLGLLLGYLILPAVNWLDRHLKKVLPRSASRLIAILAVYAVALLVIVGLFTYLVPVVVAQVQELIANREAITNEIQRRLAGLEQWFASNVPTALRGFAQSQIQTLRARLSALALGAVTGAVTSIGNVLLTLVGLLVIPFWLIYVLYDAGKFGRGVLGLIPQEGRPDITNISRLFNDVVIAYVRGQLIVASIAGILSGLGLFLIGVDFAVLLGIITAVGDLIPTVGPILAAIPTVIIAGLERPILALWAVLILFGIQQLESFVIGPRIVGESVRLSPAVIIVLLVIAGDLFGFLGLLLVVPIAAFLRDVIRYLALRTAREPSSPDGALYQVRKARLGD